jgi:hypothetical protein
MKRKEVFKAKNEIVGSDSKMTEEKWIQSAVKKKGALRSDVRDRYGKKGFTQRGTIKQDKLKQMSREKTKHGHPTKASRRARLALTLGKLRKKKGKKRKKKRK